MKNKIRAKYPKVFCNEKKGKQGKLNLSGITIQ